MERQTYRIETLGCKANLYDSRRLAEALEGAGLRPAAGDEAPDLCIVNTCTVTATADRKSRQQAARLARRFPDARVLVTGCYASAAPEDLADVPGVEAVYGRDEWPALLQSIGADAQAAEGDFGIGAFGRRTRAFMKVQEGCAAGCSYCILPGVRGRPRSRPLRNAVEEARRLVAAGHAEIVLTGIHLGWYGRDLDGGASLADLVRAVAETPGLGRLRLSSVEALEVGEPLLEAMQHPTVCAHLHLPLQSGDAGVLERMNRPYGPEEFLRVVEMGRDALDRPAITTDVMVGFPGETEAAFERTVAVCRRAAFSRMHVFPFSPRPGTPAADMPDRVPPPVVQERSEKLRALGREMAVDWAESFVGQQVRVAFERCRDGRLTGYSDRYVRVSATGGPDQVGTVGRVHCTVSRGSSLVGEVEAQG
ncbi:MAG: tRNA (N(6)-L-threonylcarbamoyladenosine(37)-C(2))-methylthiotransferase MtaB [Candidatus Brocadiia bacterium]